MGVAGFPTPRSLYVHVPFCRHRCGYCNFSVVAGRDDLIDRFLSAIDIELQKLNRPVVDTVFLGGGTPTHLNMKQLNQMMEMIFSRLKLGDAPEVSVEANPEDITQDKLKLLVDWNVNRISLGVQSFDTAKLKHLERGHSGHRAIDAVQACHERIGNVSIDLIFAAPEETLSDWQRDLETAIDLPISHLSTYALTIEKGTSFFARDLRGELPRVGDDIEAEMYEAAMSACDAGGLVHYEISNFARSGSRCRHNLAYWQGEGWYAAGPGAARFVHGVRSTNHRSTMTYLKRIESGDDPVAESEQLTAADYARELVGFGVRMLDGVDLAAVGSRTGVDTVELFFDAIDVCQQRGWIVQGGTRIRLTREGILFGDSVAREFLF